MSRYRCGLCEQDFPHRATHEAVHSDCILCGEHLELHHPGGCEGLFKEGVRTPPQTYAQRSANWGMG